MPTDNKRNLLPYDLNSFLASQKSSFRNRAVRKEILPNYIELKQKVKLHFENMFDVDGIGDAYERLVRQHEAIIGIKKSVNYFKDEIKEYLQKNHFFQLEFPEYYQDLTEAIFHDIFGLGPLISWFYYKDSQAAYVIGTDIFFEIGDLIIKQPISFESVERVYELVRALTLKDSKAKVNEFNPKLEIDMSDGTRVTLFIPPLSKKVSITFRRFVVNKMTFEQQAEKLTIPYEAVNLFKAINLTKSNIIIAGPVKSGKSTMLSTFYGARDVHQKSVCVEKHSELQLSEKYPGRPLDELIATEKELLNIFPFILRTDFSYLIVGELRSVEAELCMQGCERGSGGLLTTYHTQRSQNVPSQLARLILDSFPNRRYESELLRVADNIDFVIVMEELSDKTKRVESISEIRIDYANARITVHEILKYDFIEKQWRYRFDVSETLLQKMKKTDYKWFQVFIKELTNLENKRRIEHSNSSFCLDSNLIF